MTARTRRLAALTALFVLALIAFAAVRAARARKAAEPLAQADVDFIRADLEAYGVSGWLLLAMRQSPC